MGRIENKCHLQTERANGVFQKFSGSLGQGRCSGGARLGSLPTRPPWPLLPLPSAMLPVPEAFQSLVTHFCVGETTVTGKHRAPFQHKLQQPCCASLTPQSHRGPAGRVLTWALRVPLRRPGSGCMGLGCAQCYWLQKCQKNLPRIRVWVLICSALQHMGITPLKLNFRDRHLIRLPKVGFSLSQVSVLSGF